MTEDVSRESELASEVSRDRSYRMPLLALGETALVVAAVAIVIAALVYLVSVVF